MDTVKIHRNFLTNALDNENDGFGDIDLIPATVTFSVDQTFLF